MKLLIGGALVALVATWIGGWIWGLKRRREGTRDRVTPQWLNEHGSRQWK
jgi:hypothetical protein